MGYNYGGIKALQLALSTGKGLLAFNYEQQGDVVAAPGDTVPQTQSAVVLENLIGQFLSSKADAPAAAAAGSAAPASAAAGGLK